jgi:predicted hotdog family 3-hydroxylacyl-ACP dehydratase
MIPAIEQLLPHRAPMRWIDALTSLTATTATATACFRAGDFPVVHREVLETALVECIAQTAAAALGQRGRQAGGNEPPALGMLIAVTNFRLLAPAPLDQILQIEITERKRLGPMLLISGNISCAGHPVATGDLTLYA